MVTLAQFDKKFPDACGVGGCLFQVWLGVFRSFSDTRFFRPRLFLLLIVWVL